MNNNLHLAKLIPIFYCVISPLFACCQTPTLRNDDLPNKAPDSVQEQVESQPLGAPKKLSEGILWYAAEIKSEHSHSKIWVYLPEKPVQEKLPCVLIAPAGSHLIDGSSLGKGDQAEHLPYVKAGFVVVAYEIDGAPINDSNVAMVDAMRAFKKSNAGLINQKNALDYALEKVALINPDKIFIAGHSSAATHALFVAANEPRIKGVIAYAPATDIAEFARGEIDMIGSYVSGFKEFIAQSSPINNTEKITVPVFLFHSKTDAVVSIKMTETFAEKLKKTNRDVTFVIAQTGDHYDSMIKQGIPQGVTWLNNRK